jgi:hypothetical protein
MQRRAGQVGSTNAEAIPAFEQAYAAGTGLTQLAGTISSHLIIALLPGAAPDAPSTQRVVIRDGQLASEDDDRRLREQDGGQARA